MTRFILFTIVVLAFTADYSNITRSAVVEAGVQRSMSAIGIKPLLDYRNPPNVEDLPEFENALYAMCGRLGLNPQFVVDVMDLESQVDPSKRNRKSGAAGLIQFTNPALKQIRQDHGLNYTKDEVAQMDAIDQLSLVELYFESAIRTHGRPTTLTDTYLLVFKPIWANKHVAEWGEALCVRPDLDYNQNRGLDTNKDGVITIHDIADKLEKNYGRI